MRKLSMLERLEKWRENKQMKSNGTSSSSPVLTNIISCQSVHLQSSESALIDDQKPRKAKSLCISADDRKHLSRSRNSIVNKLQDYERRKKLNAHHRNENQFNIQEQNHDPNQKSIEIASSECTPISLKPDSIENYNPASIRSALSLRDIDDVNHGLSTLDLMKTPEKALIKRSRVSKRLLSPNVLEYNNIDSLQNTHGSIDRIDNTQTDNLKMFLERHADLRNLYKKTEEELISAKNDLNEFKNRSSMAIEEIAALTFLNAVQEQRISELECNVSSSQIHYHESNASKNKKHKAEIAKLNQEKIDYEERANLMIQQMSEQMSALQRMAMTRIESLEKELMDSRRKCERTEEECQQLRSLLDRQRTAISAVENDLIEFETQESVDCYEDVLINSVDASSPRMAAKKKSSRRMSSVFHRSVSSTETFKNSNFDSLDGIAEDEEYSDNISEDTDSMDYGTRESLTRDDIHENSISPTISGS